MKSDFPKRKDTNKSKENNNNKIIKKNKSSYYQKIYAIHSDSEEENKEQNKSLIKLRKIKENQKKLNLMKVFKGPQKDEKSGPKWPKVTHPKLPFSNIKKDDPEIKKLKKELLKPSRLYHDFHTIQWIRKKYSDSVIEKSVFSILPGEGKAKIPINESEAKKRQRKMIEYLNSFKGPVGREKYVNINPKYLYNETTYDKIKKLKEIFLEFDGNGYRKMEMNELLSLFNQNNIRADIKELVKLFFKDKKVKKDDYSKLYLNFYQFLTFALTKEQDFRQFMRNIKEKYNKSNDEENKDKDTYLPMNLNLVLDYFLNKGKERSSIEKIEKAINEMDNIIKENNMINSQMTQKDVLYYDIKNESKSKKQKMKNVNINKSENSKFIENRRESNRELSKIMGHNYSSSDITEQKNISKTNIKPIKKSDEIEVKFEKIDFKQLIQEFSNLFNYNRLNKIENNDKILIKTKNNKKNFKNRINNYNKVRRKSQEIKSLSTMNFLSPTNTHYRKIIHHNSQNNEKFLDNPELYELADDENEIMGDALKHHMNENTILKMNVKNFEKLHDVKLALDATKEQIKEMNRNVNEKYIKSFKSNGFDGTLPGITISSKFNKNEYKSTINNNYKKVDTLYSKSKQLTNYKNNSVKTFKRSEQSMINNKSVINNCFSDIINNNSRYSKTNRTFLNIFCGKSQLVNMSQDQTDYASKNKFDYVPPELIFT